MLCTFTSMSSGCNCTHWESDSLTCLCIRSSCAMLGLVLFSSRPYIELRRGADTYRKTHITLQQSSAVLHYANFSATIKRPEGITHLLCNASEERSLSSSSSLTAKGKLPAVSLCHLRGSVRYCTCHVARLRNEDTCSIRLDNVNCMYSFCGRILKN